MDHLLTSDRYLPMIPSVLPYPAEIALLTGLCELAGAIGLLVPRTRRLAGIMLAIYFVCVFPANIKNAVEAMAVEGLPTASWYDWIRLVLQPMALWWALRASEVIGPRHTGLIARTGRAEPALMSMGNRRRHVWSAVLAHAQCGQWEPGSADTDLSGQLTQLLASIDQGPWLVPAPGTGYLIPMSLIQNIAVANVPFAGRPAGAFPSCVSG